MKSKSDSTLPIVFLPSEHFLRISFYCSGDTNLPGVSRCPLNSLHSIYPKSNSRQKTSYFNHFSLSLSLLLPLSLTVSHWIINIFGTCYVTQLLVRGRIIATCNSVTFLFEQECTCMTNALIEIMRGKGVHIIFAWTQARWQPGNVRDDANTCCCQSHASPWAVDPAAVGLFLLDLEG